mmetsp:Transcript_87738/g.256470  ORF Transcript_87738/g.256470 Transcript_87738/m.256470 type:complete len:323 (+) Transcript_87738:630-1598(+)
MERPLDGAARARARQPLPSVPEPVAEAELLGREALPQACGAASCRPRGGRPRARGGGPGGLALGGGDGHLGDRGELPLADLVGGLREDVQDLLRHAPRVLERLEVLDLLLQGGAASLQLPALRVRLGRRLLERRPPHLLPRGLGLVRLEDLPDGAAEDGVLLHALPKRPALDAPPHLLEELARVPVCGRGRRPQAGRLGGLRALHEVAAGLDRGEALRGQGRARAQRRELVLLLRDDAEKVRSLGHVLRLVLHLHRPVGLLHLRDILPRFRDLLLEPVLPVDDAPSLHFQLRLLVLHIRVGTQVVQLGQELVNFDQGRYLLR